MYLKAPQGTNALCVEMNFTTKISLIIIGFEKHQEQMIFRCFKCGKGFESSQLLDEHKKGQGEKCVKSICKTCDLECLSHFHLKKHMRTHTEAVVKSHLCPECGKAFKCPGQLKDHLDTHASEPKYECDICGKKSFTQSSHKNHVRRHLMERKHPCEVCGKRFKDKSKLKTHFVIHTGEKNHVCDFCGKTFNHSGSLWLHRKDVHKVSRKKPLVRRYKPNLDKMMVASQEVVKQQCPTSPSTGEMITTTIQ